MDSIVTLSENAAKRISYLLSKEGSTDTKLRISVSGGGCSGFKYNYDFVTEKASDDLVLERSGAIVLIDSASAEFMKGCVVDYIETLGNASFEIKNPNAVSKCGCGNSFAL